MASDKHEYTIKIVKSGGSTTLVTVTARDNTILDIQPPAMRSYSSSFEKVIRKMNAQEKDSVGFTTSNGSNVIVTKKSTKPMYTTFLASLKRPNGVNVSLEIAVDGGRIVSITPWQDKAVNAKIVSCITQLRADRKAEGTFNFTDGSVLYINLKPAENNS
jgi:hypothetical protein